MTFSIVANAHRLLGTVVLVGALLMVGSALAQGPGVASGFGVDGNLLSNLPSTPPFNTARDWVPGANPPATAVLDNAGVPLDPSGTFHVVDLTENADQNVFSGSNKVFDNPNTYEWKTGSVPQKDDINHALFHRRFAPNGDVWAVMAGDRRSTDGTSYIDFELLQAGLTKNADKTFSSPGPHGGRTIGDLVVTLQLTRGGSQATFYVQRWEADTSSASGYNYHDLTPAAGEAYAAANIDSSVWVPYGAFGSTSYDVNAFGEAALNLTRLLDNINPCLTVPVVFVRTKSSASPNAELKDFVDPIRLSLTVGAHAEAGPTKVLDCEDGEAVLEGSSLTQNATYAWTAYDGGHIVSGGTTLHPTVDAVGFYVLTVTSEDGCLDSDTVQVKRRFVPPPDTTLYLCAPVEICIAEMCDDDDDDHHPSGGCRVYEDGSSGHRSSSGDSSSDDEPEVYCFTPDTSGVYCFVFQREAEDHHSSRSDDGSSRTVSGDGSVFHYESSSDTTVYIYDTVCVTVVITDPPVIICPPDMQFECLAAGDFGTPTVEGADGPPVLVQDSIPGNCEASYTLRRMWIAINECGADTCVQIITVEDTQAPVVTCPPDQTLSCDEPIPPPSAPSAEDNCDRNPTVRLLREVENPSGDCAQSYELVRYWEARDACGNADTCTQTFIIEDREAPTITCAADLTIDCDDLNGEWGVSTARDNCDPNPVVRVVRTDSLASGGCAYNYELHLYWEARDACGNADTCVQIVTVTDAEAPVITCPPDMRVVCDDFPADWGTATATDECDPNPTVTFLREDRTPGDCVGSYQLERYWVATDACGNADTCVQTITVEDLVAPVITCRDDLTIDCTQPVPEPDPPGATDTCDPDPRVDLVDERQIPGDCPGNYQIERYWVATDACGNADTCVRTITVQDTAPPVGTCRGDITISCNDPIPPPIPPEAHDLCDPNPRVELVSTDEIPGNCVGNYRIERMWVVTDACGNADTCIRVITVEDTRAPQITCRGDITISCDEQLPPPIPPEAQDLCDPNPRVELVNTDQIPGNCDGNYRVVRMWVATDACGNADTCTETITVEDRTPPTVYCPAGIDVACDQLPPDFGRATAGDNCDPNPTATFLRSDSIPGDCANGYQLRRYWVATDWCGNADTCYQLVTVGDQTPPAVTCPPLVRVTCPADVPAPDTSLVTAEDACGGRVTKAFVRDVISDRLCENQYIITRTYRATDNCGNSAECTQIIEVDDDVPPTIECPPDESVECWEQIPPPQPGSVSAFDNCGGVPRVNWIRDRVFDSVCTGQYKIARTYEAIDACENRDECTQTIYVSNIRPPHLECPPPVSVKCRSQVPPPDAGAVQVEHGCQQGIMAEFVRDVVTDSFCANQLTITRWYRATNDCGLSDSCAQVITVYDDVPPETDCPSRRTVACARNIPAPDTSLITATDNCGGHLEKHLVEESVIDSTCNGHFTVARLYEVHDLCGNESYCTALIDVRDTYKPEIQSCPDDVQVTCASEFPAGDTSLLIAIDNCGGPVVKSFRDREASRECPNIYVVERTYQATDECGNFDECTQRIVVYDDVPPAITCPPETTVVCASDVPDPDTSRVTASDNCDGPVIKRFVRDDVVWQSCKDQLEIARIYRATDNCGNSAECTQTIVVYDDVRPEVTCYNDTTVLCADDVPSPNANGIPATDNCGPVHKQFVEEIVTPGACPNQFTVEHVYQISDDCGNFRECVHTIRVNDSIPPVITCAKDLTVTCASEIPDPGDYSGISATDNCSGRVDDIHWIDDRVFDSVCASQFKVARSYLAFDWCHNTDTCTQTITVNDQTPPTLTCPGTVTVSCASAVPAPNLDAVTASDNCQGPVTKGHAGDRVTDSTCDNRFVIQRGYWAMDECGNADTCYQTIRVNDTDRPDIICPNGITVACASLIPDPDTSLVQASDRCGGRIVKEWVDDRPVSEQFCANNYRIERTYRATDECGNFATCTQLIRVYDDEAPVITCPNDTTVACDDLPQNWGRPTATDNCDTDPIIEFVGEDRVPSDLCPQSYQLKRWWLAKDVCGNADTCVQTITVDDTEAPVVTCPPDADAECDNLDREWGTATATDNCDPKPLVHLVSEDTLAQQGECFYQIKRGFQAEDACHNLSDICYQTITVGDTTSPVCYLPSDTAFFVCDVGAEICLPIRATDNCDDVAACRASARLGDGAPSEPTTVTEGQWCYTVVGAGDLTVSVVCTDNCGNTCAGSFVVRITINRPPECHVPNDTTIFLCEPREVCLPYWGTDPDNNLAFCGSVETKGRDGCREGQRCAENIWCYTPEVNETIDVFVRCTDSCGAICEKTFRVTFVINSGPTCDVPNDTTIFQCEPAKVTIPLVAMDIDKNLAGCRLISGPGTIISNQWEYTPSGSETVNISFECADSCGAACGGRFQVTFVMNLPPTCEFVPPSPPRCIPPQYAVPVTSTDPEGAPVTCEQLEGPGQYSNGVWQWTPIPGTVDTVVIRCSDTCGAFCDAIFEINVPNPQPPICIIRAENEDFFLCEPGEIRVPVSAINHEEEDIVCEVSDGPGEIVNGEWIYFATTTETFDVTVRCTDICGVFCEASFRATVTINSDPVCDLPDDQSFFPCKSEEIALPYSATDIDGNLTGCEVISGPGALQNGNWVFTPTSSGTYTVTIRCWDECEAYCEGSFTIRVDIDEPPICNLPNDTTIGQCFPAQVRLPVFATFFEPGQDGGARSTKITRPFSERIITGKMQREDRRRSTPGLAAGFTEPCAVIAGAGTIVDGFWIYTPSGDETVTVTVRCTDECGLTCEGQFVVNFVINDPPVCSFRLPVPPQCIPPIIVVPFTSEDPETGPVTCQIISGKGELVGQVYQYEPIGGEEFDVTVRCTDTCGAFCDITFNISVPAPVSPICVIPAGPQEFFLCAPGQVSVPFSATGGTGALTCEVIDGPGAIVNGQWTYNAQAAGEFDVTVQCTDVCAVSCQGTFHVSIVLNTAPTCDLPDDQVIDGCAGGEVRLPLSAHDIDGNLTGCQVVSGPGAIVNGEWVYTATSAGVVNVTVRCTDECGASCEGTFSVTLGDNSPPVCATEDQYLIGCDQVTATVPLNTSDPDGNLKRCRVVSGPGVIQNGNWVFTTAISGVFNVTVECVDSCGATCVDEFTVTFDLNDPPACNMHDTTITVCGESDVVLTLDTFDPDGNLTGCVLLSGPGAIVGNEWYYHLIEDTPVDLVVQCTDECGMTCISRFRVSFIIGNLNLCDFPLGDTVYMCGPGEFCFDMPPGCDVAFGMGKVRGIDLCFTANQQGTYWAAIECVDDCGNVCTDTAYFEVVFTDLPDCGPSIVYVSRGSAPCDCPRRGDMNGDGEITAEDMSTIVAIALKELTDLHLDDPCPWSERADVNCDGTVDLRDIQMLGAYMFRNGPAPCNRCPSANSAAGAGGQQR